MATYPRLRPLAALLLTALSLAGCGTANFGAAQPTDQECLARVMYFESLRSSDEGMLAVGTVVMNRVQDPKYPKSVCGVIGQRSQFAEGALTKHVDRRSKSWTRAERVAASVLSGERHADVGGAKFFHTAGYSFPYRNMHYVAMAGGNVFYEKKTPGTFTPGYPWEQRTMVAEAKPAPEPKANRVQVASADEDDEEVAPAPVRRAAAAAPPVSRARPVVLASADDDEASVDARPQAPARPRASVSANDLDTAPMASGARPRPVVPATAPVPLRAARPSLAATADPATRPKPIVLAMNEPRPRPGRPRSIEELIDMDLHQR